MDPFKNIRPYTNAEVAEVLQSLANNSSVLKALIGLQFPGILSKAPFLKFFVKRNLAFQIKNIQTIDDYQMIFKDLMEKVVKESIASFKVNGLERLNKNDNYLYISNHRDISLDAALLALHLHKSGFKTFNIAVGNNLMEETWASDLFRLNKSFIIQRSGGTKKEIYSGLLLASQFIHQSIFQDNTSVWIAQKQGRAKDGIDETDPALLKMIHLSERKLQHEAHYFNTLKVVPVSISYEYDPNDQLKARELDLLQANSEYLKEKDEDLISIANGITGFKGNVTINLSEPMKFAEDDNYQMISNKITQSILTNYKLHASNYAACKLMGLDFTQETFDAEEIAQAETELNQRVQSLEAGARSKLLEQYANPVIRQIQST
ncbi:1-acyl-sn-glycerol-3-phosphate acyltransferase [Gammaproteobacteria bacterium]|nr:1-acyl-sn-glycerol-3-phosphate acyltransferase [Gammaproteobacteria bacterium]MDC1147723.1 1-acyl-sn-glycerol-3-phosphate acyltransferase [Gammaproteobacteria bacterium]